jgi:hypothetical protein
MKLGFSEFSYGYAFTENLIRSSAAGPTSAPIFPNLVQEGTLGYDVKISLPGLPLFFQFKLPELMVRNTAREIAQLGLPGLAVPFFRMPLMRRDLSDQHALLIRLETRFPNAVFYASPKLESANDFNIAYLGAGVHLGSALFSPSDIGQLPDNDKHSVSYTAGSHVGWRCSEPKQVKAKDFGSVMSRLNEQFGEQDGRPLEETVREVRDKVWPFIAPQLREAEAEVRERIESRRPATTVELDADGDVRSVSTELLVLRELVRVGLGVDFVIAQPRKQKASKE